MEAINSPRLLKCKNQPETDIIVEEMDYIAQVNLCCYRSSSVHRVLFGFGRPGRIDTLLGANIFVEILGQGRRKGPVGFETDLGWVLCGNTGATSTYEQANVTWQPFTHRLLPPITSFESSGMLKIDYLALGPWRRHVPSTSTSLAKATGCIILSLICTDAAYVIHNFIYRCSSGPRFTFWYFMPSFIFYALSIIQTHT